MFLMKWSYKICTQFVHSLFKLYDILSNTRKIKGIKKMLANVVVATFTSTHHNQAINSKTLYKTLIIPVVGIFKPV